MISSRSSGQQIPRLDQGFGGLSNLLQICFSGGIALGNRAPWVARRLACFARRWKRNRRADQGAAGRPTGGEGLAGAADIGMARIPARQRRQGYRLIGQKYATDFVAILVDRGHQARIGRTHLRRYVVAMPSSGPKSRRVKRRKGSGKLTPGMALKTSATLPAALPCHHRGGDSGWPGRPRQT